MRDYDGTNTILEENLEMSGDSYRMSGGLPLQCRQCRFWDKNDPLHCEKYKFFKKPKSILWAQKKCSRFAEADYYDK